MGRQESIVGVFPREQHAQRKTLFRALEEAFPARFEPRRPGEWRGIDAAIVFSLGDTRLQAAAAQIEVPHLVLLGGVAGADTQGPSPFRVEFSDSQILDPRLRGRTSEERAARLPRDADTPVGNQLLAHSGGRPLWYAHAEAGPRRYVAAFVPPELSRGDTLRNLLRSGSFMQLLPVVHFLRDVTDYWAWDRPQPRASFLFDDPNLHWPSYGYLRYRELVDHARRHRYHVGIATVPLDAWFVHPGAARIARQNPDCLSFVVHGNDHIYRELERVGRVGEAAIAAQAIRRVAALEQRAGIRVGRVMIPPHGRYSERMLAALVATGFEALCGDFPPSWWLDASQPERLPGSWRMAELAAGGLPVITRYDFSHPHAPDEFLFWLYLDRPVVLYGHHTALAGGLDVLAHEAQQLYDLADMTWTSLESIARTNFVARKDGDVLRVRMFSRQVELRVPADVTSVIVEVPPDDATVGEILLFGNRAVPLSGAIQGEAAGRRASSEVGEGTLTLRRQPAAPQAEPQLPRRRVSPIARRAFGEARDRARPFIERFGLEPLLRRLEQDYETFKANNRSR